MSVTIKILYIYMALQLRQAFGLR